MILILIFKNSKLFSWKLDKWEDYKKTHSIKNSERENLDVLILDNAAQIDSILIGIERFIKKSDDGETPKAKWISQINQLRF